MRSTICGRRHAAPRRAALAAAFFTLAVAAFCARAPQRPDVLLVTIDTSRADRVGAYGDLLARTPELDALARRGVLFTRAACQVPLTAPSHASILTGSYPPYHGVRKNGGFALDGAFDTMGEILGTQGYKTAGFVSAFALHSRYGFSQGFATWEDVNATREHIAVADKGGIETQHTRYPERSAAETIDHALAWLASAGRGPVFLWVHLYDPHTPYQPAAPFNTLYPRDLYRGEMAAMDRELGRLLDAFGRRHEPVIAVLSDHGEGLGDKGEPTHGYLLYEATQHIPMILAAANGIDPGQLRSDLVETVDLLPTILALTGVPWSGPIQGRDLTRQEASPDSLAYMETLYGKLAYSWADLRAIRLGDWKYILGPKPELFDLRHDPGETRNLAGEQAALASELTARIQPILSQKPDLPASAGQVEITREEAEALAALGYVGTARLAPGESNLDEDIAVGVGIDPKDGNQWVAKYGQIDSLVAARNTTAAAALAREVGLAVGAGPVVRLAAGVVLYGQRDHLGALEVFEGIRRDSPDYADVYVNIAAANLALERIEEARTALTRALELDPKGAMANYNMGRILAHEGKLDSAVVVLRKAFETDPGQIQSLLLLAKVYIQKGYAEDAYKTLVEVLMLAPNHPEARQLRAAMEREIPDLRKLARDRKTS